MKKKRILCGAMAAAMTVSLAACSKGQTDAAPVTSTAAAETETTTAANAAANSTYTGTVTAVSAASLTLSTESDGDITVPLTDATTYTRGGMGGGQAPDGNPPELPSGNNGSTPPDMPADGAGQGSAPADGQAPDASGQQPQGSAPNAKPDDNGSAPEKPADDGQALDGQPGGEAEALTYESISVGDTVTVTVGDDGSAATVELAGGMGGSSKPESYDAATEFTADDTRDGAVLDDETNAGSGGDGCANLYISADSTWVVTGDSVLTNLYSAGTIVDTQGRAVTIVDTDGTVLVQGMSDCTVTVSGYSATVDASGASVSDSFSDYKVAKL